MDFFERQEKARRNTTLLVGYFIAGVSLLIVTLYLVIVAIFYWGEMQHERRHPTHQLYSNYEVLFWHPHIFLGVTLGTLAVIIIGSLSKTIELSKGGSAVADMMEADLVSSNTTDPDERKLLNIVEEMSIASGVRVPSVYIMRNEYGINAFAAGHSTSDAVVCVTRGAIKLLTRDELQGVIGHEFSHILNGDMRLNLRLMSVIFGIVCLAVIGRILLRMDGGRKNPLPFLGLAVIVISWAGAFFGHLIQAAVSRQREFLADASAVQFTRNPAGLTGALKKIGGLTFGSQLSSNRASEASHMFFGDAVGSSWIDLLNTHPPLTERIRALDPSFDGKFPHVSEENMRSGAASSSSPSHPYFEITPDEDIAGGLAGLGAAAPGILTASVLASAGRATPEHIRYANQLRSEIPSSLRDVVREPFGASALIYALLSTDSVNQLPLIEQNISTAIRAEVERILPEVSTIANRAKLPLVDLALPALRQLSPEQYKQFKQTLDQLIESDGTVDLFEYMLRKIVLRHLDAKFNGARKPSVQFYSLKGVSTDCDVLLSALARAGQTDIAKITDAFQQGAASLARITPTNFNLLPVDQCDLAQVDAVLNRLDQAVPQIKKNVLDACARVVAADGVIEESEAELLRTVAETLDCPIPPFISSAN